MTLTFLVFYPAYCIEKYLSFVQKNVYIDKTEHRLPKNSMNTQNFDNLLSNNLKINSRINILIFKLSWIFELPLQISKKQFCTSPREIPLWNNTYFINPATAKSEFVSNPHLGHFPLYSKWGSTKHIIVVHDPFYSKGRKIQKSNILYIFFILQRHGFQQNET